MNGSPAGPGTAYCDGCHAELAPMRAAWGQTSCPACAKDEPRVPRWYADCAAVPLEDLNDVIGYVITVVNRRFANLPLHEREEYIGEGIHIVYRLHREAWRREQTPSFATFLSTYLPLRLKDWRRRQLRMAGEAKRGPSGSLYVGKESLDAMAEAGRDLAAPDVEELAA